MPRNRRHPLLRALTAVAHAWIACASVGCWPPPWWLAEADDPCVCVACGEPFACPLDWELAEHGHWRVDVRCGECGHRRTVVLPDADAACLNERLADDARAIAGEVRRLDAERMAAEIETLTRALRFDLIGAGDFAPRSRGRVE